MSYRHDDLTEKIDQAEFLRICQDAKDQALILNRGLAAVPSAKQPITPSTHTENQSKKPNRRAASEGPAIPNRRGPKLGEDLQKWLSDWLAKGKPEGKCAYCRRGQHAPSNCWYLIPDIRPETWQPKKGTWAVPATSKTTGTMNAAVDDTSDEEDGPITTRFYGAAVADQPQEAPDEPYQGEAHSAIRRPSNWIADTGT
ncbi:hypothetical protein GB937_010891, partial [Aspergillus fischeri]